MLHATRQLSALHLAGHHPHQQAALLAVITRHGSIADADFLLPLFLQTKDERLLQPIQAWGDATVAEILFKHSICNGQLKEAFPPETLQALSYLQHAETEKVLMGLYKGLFNKELHWDLHVSICLALLNYSCKGYENDIKEEIEKCLNEWLFPEMIPALAIKTGDDALAERLYQHGCTKASSDASAGLILGLSLFGQQKRGLFKQIILNPDWEAGSTGTGNVYYTLMGMSYLNITIAELFDDMKSFAPAERERMHRHLFLLADLLQEKMRNTTPYDVRCIPLHAEPYAQVYEAMFEPADGNSVFEIINQHVPDKWLQEELTKDFNHVQDLCGLKMDSEAEWAYLAGKS